MTLLQLHYLDQIVKLGSINQAAKSLFVAQSSISNAIRELEGELGITIFFRHNKGMRLTREGQELYDRVSSLLEKEKNIKDYFATNSQHAPMRLAISTLHFPFASEALVSFLQEVEPSDYEIRFKECNIQYTIDDVETDQSDIGLILMSINTEDFLRKVLRERNLTFYPIASMRPRAFLRKDHPLAQKKELSVSDFEEYPYVILDLEYSSSSYSDEFTIKGFSKPKQVIHLSDRATVYNVVRYTDAYSIGTGILPTGYSDENLISLPITKPADHMQIGYIHPARKKLSAGAERFVEILEEKLKKYADL